MATDTAGNQAIDFVWGGFPIQPDTDRGANTLDVTLDNHQIAAYGWSGYPSFTPGVGIAVPDLAGKTSAQAKTTLEAVGLVRGTVTGSSGVVTVQSVAAGASVAVGTSVNITIA